MRFVQRDLATGKVVGHYANEQPYAKEALPDDHPDILAWRAEKDAEMAQDREKRSPRALEERIAKLESQVAELVTRGGQ